MGYSACRRNVSRAPTFRVVMDTSGSIYRGVDFTLAVYATDENGCHLNVNGTATLSLSGADASDALDDDGVALSTITIANGIWSSTKVAIDGGSGPESGVTIDCDSSGYTTGSSDSFSLSEYGVVASFDASTIATEISGTFTSSENYLYVAGSGGSPTHPIWRVALSDFSTVDKYPNGSFGISHSIVGLAADSTCLYVDDNASIYSKILLSDMTTYDTYSGSIYSRTLRPHGLFLFAGAGSSLSKIQISDMTLVDSVSATYYASGMDVDDTYIYGCPYGTKTIEKRLQSDLSLVDTLDLSSYLSNNLEGVNTQVTVSNGLIYLSSKLDHIIVKIQASNMTHVSDYDSSANIGKIGGFATDDTYIWALGLDCDGSLRKFTKLKVSDMSLVWSIDVSSYVSAGSYGIPCRVQLRGGYAYALYPDPKKILKIAQ